MMMIIDVVLLWYVCGDLTVMVVVVVDGRIYITSGKYRYIMWLGY